MVPQKVKGKTTKEVDIFNDAIFKIHITILYPHHGFSKLLPMLQYPNYFQINLKWFDLHSAYKPFKICLKLPIDFSYLQSAEGELNLRGFHLM